MIRLDATDMAILRALAREGRLSKTALAERAGLSPSPAWARLKRLEAAGLIEGYRAQIDLRRLGPHVTVFVTVELASHTQGAMRAFEAAMDRHEEIAAAWALGGGVDYLVQVVARDVEAYQRLIDALLESQIGIARYYTYIVTKTVKAGGPPPLDLFADHSG